MMIIYTVIKPR